MKVVTVGNSAGHSITGVVKPKAPLRGHFDRLSHDAQAQGVVAVG